MNKLWKLIYNGWTIAISITTLVFAFVPESCFTCGWIQVAFPIEWIIICNRLLLLLVLVILVFAAILLCRKYRKEVHISCNNCHITVEYGNLFDKSEYLKVVHFDECFTTQVGTAPADIKSWTICGQFLTKYHSVDFKAIVQQSGLKPSDRHSEYNNQEAYQSGSLVPYKDYLLLAFAKLDKDGLGRMSREDYLSCLDLLWKEIDKYYGGRNVAIPLLGSGITRFKDESLTRQQLLDMIIASYKLSPYKMKSPAKLCIVCQKEEDLSINRIGEYI